MSETEKFNWLIESLKQRTQLKDWFLIIAEMPATFRGLEIKKIATELKTSGISDEQMKMMDDLADESTFEAVASALKD